MAMAASIDVRGEWGVDKRVKLPFREAVAQEACAAEWSRLLTSHMRTRTFR